MVRPLKHLVSRLARRERAGAGYAALRCAEPPALAALALADVPEERLQCTASVHPDPTDPTDLPDDDPFYKLSAEPDIVFRDVQW